MSTAEVEAALTEHPAVAEAAVVGRPHKVKGECLYCFVTLKNSREFNHMLVEELKRLGEAHCHGVYMWFKEKKSLKMINLIFFCVSWLIFKTSLHFIVICRFLSTVVKPNVALITTL